MIIPAAACTLLAEMITGPRRTCEVVVASRSAIHAQTGDERLPLLTLARSGGARLPGSMIIGAGVDASAWVRVQEARRVTIGAGGVDVGTASTRVVVARWWGRPTIRMPGSADDLSFAADRLAALDPGSVERVDPGRPTAPAAIAAQLIRSIGRGPGLTPEADDVLAGALTAWWHLARTGRFPAAAEALACGSAAVRVAGARTTAVSAALLAHAAQGRSVVELHALLDALRRPELINGRYVELATIGHSSGRALARGAAVALASAVGEPVSDRLVS